VLFRFHGLAAEKARSYHSLLLIQGIEYQQNLTVRRIAIIIFRAKSNRLKALLPHGFPPGCSHYPSCMNGLDPPVWILMT